METTISTYDKQALDFLNATNTAISFKYKTFDFHFEGDKQRRAIWRVTIKNKLSSYTFDFGNSINAGKEQPTAYSVLACLQKSDVGDYEEFCSEFGYDKYIESEKTGAYIQNRLARKIYNAVCREYAAVCDLWSDELEQLQEIN